MANTDAAVGFVPVRNAAGGEIRTNKYTLTTGQTVYRGDLVKIVSAGTVQAADTGGEGASVIGVAAEHVDDSGSAGGKEVLVYDDPNTLFMVQADTGTSVAATDVGATADHVAGSGNSTTGISGHELDSSNIGTGAQLKIVGLHEMAGNSWGEHAKLVVRINEHFYSASVGGV